MYPVFYQYKIEHNILDELIGEFKKRSWFFEEMPSGYFHKFKWPDIVLSDKTAKVVFQEHDGNLENDYTIELLGCYQPSEHHGEQGHIILFMPKLKRAALAFAAHKTGGALGGGLNDSDIKYFIELLTTLILIHEFTHWVVHVGVFGLEINLQYENEDSVFFHEALAQIFTNYFCCKGEENLDLKELFFWLEKNQPRQYQVYKDLIWGNGIKQLLDDGVTVIPSDSRFHEPVRNEFIVKLIFSLMILRVNDKQPQSFKELKIVFDELKKIHIPEFYFDSKDVINNFKHWNWNTEGIEEFIERNKNQIIAGKYLI